MGYNSRGVRIQNSWGTDWGNAGYAILDWNYISKYSYEAETAAGFADDDRGEPPDRHGGEPGVRARRAAVRSSPSPAPT